MDAWKFSRLLVPVVLCLLGCGLAAEELASTPGGAAPSVTDSASAAEDFTTFVDQVAAEPHETVISADGQAELLIPPGALPAGTTAADLRITPLDPALLTSTPDEPSPLLTYQLEPDGLQFDTPVLLRLKPAAGEPSIYSLSLESGGEVTAPNPVLLDVNQSSGAVTVTAQLEHFSTVKMYDSGLDISITDPGDQLAGAPFTVAVSIYPDPASPWSNTSATSPAPDLNEFVVSGGSWQAYGGVTPVLVNNAPDRQQSSGLLFYREKDFTCPYVAQASVAYRASMEIRHHYLVMAAFIPARTVIVGISSDTFYCWPPEDTPTATHSPTPSPTPSPTEGGTATPTPTPTPTPKEVGCAPGLDGLRQCLDEGLLAFSFPGEEPVYAVTDNSDPARVYANPDIVAALTAPGVEFLHNAYYYPHETCALGKTCTLQTVLFVTGSEPETRQIFDLLTQPSSQLEDRTEFLLPNAQDWDASKCSTGIRLSTQAGVPDQAVFFCTVTLDTVSYGFNLTAYGSLEPEFQSNLEQGADAFLDKVAYWLLEF